MQTMSHITKPYYRIARPLFTTEKEEYLFDPDYAPCKDDQIRTAFYLEDQIVMAFEYIEPASENKNTYSNKLWQLLVQICMEVESNFKLILSSNGYQKVDDKKRIINKPFDEVNCNMKDDYYKVNQPMKLHLYSVNLHWRKNGKSKKLELNPFNAWRASSYAALDWYQAYNVVKHNRYEKFEKANFINVLNSFAALRVLLYAQFLSSSCSRTQIGVISASDIDKMFGISEKEEQYDEADFHNGSIFEVMPLKASDWNDNEKYNFEWNSGSPVKFDKYSF
jgi:hypothetical protein